MTLTSSRTPLTSMTDTATSGNGSSLPPEQGDPGHSAKRLPLGAKHSQAAGRGLWLLMNIVIPLGILLAGVLVVDSLGTVKPSAKPPEDPSFQGRLSRLPLAEVTQVLSLESIDKPLELRVDGVVVPFREVQLATEVAGRIVSKTAGCEAGSFVRRGDLLIEIDDTDYQQDVDRLTRMREQDYKALGEVDQEIINTKRLIDVATKDVMLQEREVKRLESMPAGFASQGELDRATKALLTATQSRIGFENQMSLLATRRSRLEAAEQLATTELRGAEINLERTKIYSPVDGVVVREDAELNSFIQRGSAIITLEDISKAEVAVNLRMDQLQWVLDQRRDEPAKSPLSDPVAVNASDGDAAAAFSGDAINRDQAAPAQAANQQGYSLPPTPAIIEYELSGRSDTTYRWNGTLLRYDGIGLDPRSRTVPVVIVVDQPRHFEGDDRGPKESSSPSPLVRGMFVNVKLQIRPKTPLIAIPSEAIQPGNRIWQFIPDDSVIADSEPSEPGSLGKLGAPDALGSEPQPPVAAMPVAGAAASAKSDSAASATRGGSSGTDAAVWQAGRVMVRKQIIPVDSLWLSFDESEEMQSIASEQKPATSAGRERSNQQDAKPRNGHSDQRRYWVCEVPGNEVKGGDWVVYSPLGDFDTEMSVRVPMAVFKAGR